MTSFLQNAASETTAAFEKTTNRSSTNNTITAIDASTAKAHKDHLMRYHTSGSNTNSNAPLLTHHNTDQSATEPIVGGRFLVTKLRSWRTGYPRILCFHTSYFVTLDPDTYIITNRWSYSQVKGYFAVPTEPDCMIIDVGDTPTNKKGVGVVASASSTKLKLKCVMTPRAEALTALAESIYRFESMRTTALTPQAQQPRHPFFQECHRLTRHNTRIATSLLCAPHGLIELDSQTRRPLQTYLYRSITAISFANDHDAGIILHICAGGGGVGGSSS